eukprot:12186996-Alexandrium_andersonii.AAC.1
MRKCVGCSGHGPPYICKGRRLRLWAPGAGLPNADPSITRAEAGRQRKARAQAVLSALYNHPAPAAIPGAGRGWQ